jgi:hypothetical protein
LKENCAFLVNIDIRVFLCHEIIEYEVLSPSAQARRPTVVDKGITANCWIVKCAGSKIELIKKILA